MIPLMMVKRVRPLESRESEEITVFKDGVPRRGVRKYAWMCRACGREYIRQYEAVNCYKREFRGFCRDCKTWLEGDNYYDYCPVCDKTDDEIHRLVYSTYSKRFEIRKPDNASGCEEIVEVSTEEALKIFGGD